MKPLIFDFLVDQKPDKPPTYNYDDLLNLNVSNLNGKKIPFIESSLCDVELVTKTKVIREEDDIELEYYELSTKTEVMRERDDLDMNFLELYTKTRIDREKDDEDDFINY